MVRASHVAGVSRQDCRALFAKLSDVEHQLEPCGDGRRAAVRLKRDSNTVPKCPAAAGRGKHQASRGPWVVGGDVGRWGRAGWRTRGRCVAHTRAMRGVGQGARVEEAGSPAGAHRVGGPALCGLRACRAPPSLTRACAFFLGPQGQRASDDRPHAHERAAAAARESAASSRLR